MYYINFFRKINHLFTYAISLFNPNQFIFYFVYMQHNNIHLTYSFSTHRDTFLSRNPF
jgi:hypothetical protein